MTAKRKPATTADTEPVGLGGWLILPAVGLVLSIGFFVHGVVTTLQLLADQPDLPSSLRRYGQGEIAANGLLALLGLTCIGLMARHSRRLPSVITAFYVTGLLVVVVDTIVGARLAIPVDDVAWRSIAQAFGACVVWIPYFHLSRRVRNTFVH